MRDSQGSGPTSPASGTQHLEELGRDLVAAAYLEGDFVLSSGRRSKYYFDKYLFETKPSLLGRLAEALARSLPPDVDRVAGPELRAVLARSEGPQAVLELVHAQLRGAAAVG